MTRKCIICGREHDSHEYTYFSLEGNLYVGDDGGLLNSQPNEKIYFCIPCLIKFLREQQKEAIEREESKIEGMKENIRLLKDCVVAERLEYDVAIKDCSTCSNLEIESMTGVCSEKGIIENIPVSCTSWKED